MYPFNTPFPVEVEAGGYGVHLLSKDNPFPSPLPTRLPFEVYKECVCIHMLLFPQGLAQILVYDSLSINIC